MPVLGSRELSSRSLGGRCPRGGEAAAEGHLLPLRSGKEKLRRPESGQAGAQAGAGIHAAVLPIRAAVRGGLQGLLPHHEASQRHIQSVQTLKIVLIESNFSSQRNKVLYVIDGKYFLLKFVNRFTSSVFNIKSILNRSPIV